MIIRKHKAVGIGYRLRDETDRLVESRDALSPLYYLHGEGLLLLGVEEALEGKQKGERFSVTISPENGYGTHDSSLIDRLPHDTFADQPLEPCRQFNGPLEQIATITDVSPTIVTIDAYHPLAGKTLTVEGEVIDVRDAPPEEITLGRANGQDDATWLINITLRSQKDTE